MDNLIITCLKQARPLLTWYNVVPKLPTEDSVGSYEGINVDRKVAFK